MALRALVVVASLTDPGSVIRSSYISDLSSSFRNALENVTLAFVDATALLDQKTSFATEKLFDSENSDATTTLLRNVVKLVASLLVATLLPITGWVQALDNELEDYFIHTCLGHSSSLPKLGLFGGWGQRTFSG